MRSVRAAALDTTAALGRAALDAAAAARDFTGFWRRTARACLTPPQDLRAILRHTAEMGFDSLFFVAVTAAFLGAVLVLQAGYQARRILGDMSPVGPAFLELLVREFGPALGAMMVAARMGTGIAAELGSMVVTEQVDALRMCGADPVRHLVAPRAWAGLVAVVCLGVFGTAVAELAGAATARAVFGVPWSVFWNPYLVAWGDVATGLVKSTAFGLAIPALSAWCGLTVTGGSEGVGRGTTRAIVSCSLAVVALDFLLGAVAYGVLP